MSAIVLGVGPGLGCWPPASQLASAKAASPNLVHSAAKELTSIRVAMITVTG